MSDLVLRNAKRHVKNFVDESSQLLKEHREAMDCRDCEAFLQLGIDAFDWLVRADQAFRRLVLADKEEYDPKIETALEALFRSWIPPSEFANQWKITVEKRGYQCDNREQFRKCEAEVRAIVRFLDGDELTDSVQRLRDEAMAEHAHGETAEFI